VADSSWHHYVNINLKGFPHPAPPESNSDKIGQFYGNLAIWLAPMHKRRQMAQVMYRELAEYTLLLEQHTDPIRTGENAYSVLRRSTSPCEIHELLRASRQQQFAQHCSSTSGMDDLANTEEEILGVVLDSYHKAMIRAEQETVPVGSVELSNIVSQELTTARAAAASSVGSGRINVMNETLKVREEPSVATSTVENKEWTIEIKRDPQPGEPPFEATLVFNLNIQNGVVSGEVWDGVEHQFLSTVTGTLKPLPGVENGFLALEFNWGNVSVALSGVTVETPDTVLFSGRYRTSGSSQNTSIDMAETPMAPGDGDTGTGTGQQT